MKREALSSYGKLKLLLFGLLVLATAAAFVTSGLLRRSDLQERAGKLIVELKNETDVRLRTDVYVEGQPVILEFEPGKSGVIRFNPKEPVDVTVRVFRRNLLVSSFREPGFKPQEAELVTFTFTAPDRAVISRSAPAIATTTNLEDTL